jgi:hypothetical protein
MSERFSHFDTPGAGDGPHVWRTWVTGIGLQHSDGAFEFSQHPARRCCGLLKTGRGEFGGTMDLWKTIKSLFAYGGSAPPDAARLKAGNESELSTSLRALPHGERGWITLSEARYLFSPMDDQYAFGEMDDAGKSNLGAFAAQSEHRSSVDIMPVEGRVYFTRKTRT